MWVILEVEKGLAITLLASYICRLKPKELRRIYGIQMLQYFVSAPVSSIKLVCKVNRLGFMYNTKNFLLSLRAVFPKPYFL